MKSGHISKFIPLPLSKLKNYRHLLLLRQDLPAAQWYVHFVIWLQATKCSLVFKYILRFTGNLKKKLVPDWDYPSFIFPVGFTLFLCCFMSLLDNCTLCDMWKKKNPHFWMNFVLHVHCFHYIDCLRIMRSWVILNMLQWKVKIWTMETPARGFMDYKHLL